MILTGVDLVEIDRIKRLIEKFPDRALDKFLDLDEKLLAKNPATAAGFFATKEAVSKALGVGISKECSFFDIKIRKSDKNAPYFTLSKKIILKYKITGTSLSITHDKGLAVAVVVIECDGGMKYPLSH